MQTERGRSMEDERNNNSSSETQTRGREFALYLILGLFLLGTFVLPYTLAIWWVPRSELRGRGMMPSDASPAKDPFAGIALEAKAAYVFDLRTGKVFYEREAQKRLPLASLTKLMTALVAADLISETTVVTVAPEHIQEEGDTGLYVGERWRLKDIIDFTLLTSSNDGARAIAAVAGSLGQNAYGVPEDEAERAFVRKMNEKAQELGFSSFYFRNSTGLDYNEAPGSYGTAEDVGRLLAYVLRNGFDLIERTALDTEGLTSLDAIKHVATNTNVYVNRIPGLIASKTGYTELAGGNLAVAFDVGLLHPVIAVVLGSTQEGRFTDMERLVQATFERISY